MVQNEDIALRKYLKDTVGDKLVKIQQEQESINSSITSLTETVGEIEFPGFPANYARRDDLSNLRSNLALDMTRITCRLSDEDSKKINEMKQAYIEFKESYDKLAEEKRKKRIVIKINVPAWILGVVLLIIGIGFEASLSWLNEQPAYLAHEYYEVMSHQDIRFPGAYYDDAYTRAKAGQQEDVREDIKTEKIKLERFRKYEEMLMPLLDNRSLLVSSIQCESQTKCVLVHYRFKDNDVIWKAFFLEDGSIMVTDSDFVKTPYDARRLLTSKRVKWEKIKQKK